MDRQITRVSIGVITRDNQPINTAFFRLRLWDGVGEGRGTLLWAGSYQNFSLTGPLLLISFDVPAVQVPDTLIYSVDQTDSANVFFQWANPVTVGSSPDYAWAYDYQISPYYGTPANFMARIEAVPEPGALVLLLLFLPAFAPLRIRLL